MLKHLVFCAAIATLPIVSTPSQAMNHRVNELTLIDISETTSTPYKALLKIGLDNQIPIGIVVSANKSVCSGSLIHLVSRKKVPVATLIEVFNRDVNGYVMTLQDGVINVRPADPSPHGEPLLEVRIPEFRSTPAPMASMGVKLWFTLRSVIAPEEGSAFAGGMSPAAEIIPAIEVGNQSLVTILNTIVSGGHGGVWVVRDVSLTSGTKMPFEVRSYVGEDELVRQLSLC